MILILSKKTKLFGLLPVRHFNYHLRAMSEQRSETHPHHIRILDYTNSFLFYIFDQVSSRLFCFGLFLPKVVFSRCVIVTGCCPCPFPFLVIFLYLNSRFCVSYSHPHTNTHTHNPPLMRRSRSCPTGSSAFHRRLTFEIIFNYSPSYFIYLSPQNCDESSLDGHHLLLWWPSVRQGWHQGLEERGKTREISFAYFDG